MINEGELNEGVSCKNNVQIDFNAVILFCIMISIIVLNCFYPKFCSPDLYPPKI